MCFILCFSCDFLNFFVFSFCFPLQFFSLIGVFSHNFFLFYFFAGVAEGSEFLKQCRKFQVCEFLQPVKFRNMQIFTRSKFLLRRTVHLLPALSLLCNLPFPMLH